MNFRAHFMGYFPHLCIPNGTGGWTESEDLLSNPTADTNLYHFAPHGSHLQN